MLLSMSLISGGLVVLIALALAHSLHRSLPAPDVAPVEPRSLVHVLNSAEELRDAIQRAAAFERNAAAAALERARRYDEQASLPRITASAERAYERQSDDSVSAA